MTTTDREKRPGSAAGDSARELDRSRVTIVTPTRNRAAGLRRCLEGVLSAIPPGREVVLRVIDDGSTDGTPTVLMEFATRTAGAVARVEPIVLAHGGAGAARNAAIALSDTDLIVFLDDDAVPQPGWFEALVDAPWSAKIGARGGRIISPEGGNRVERYCRWIRYNEFPPDDGPIRFLNTANCAYPREVLEQVCGLDPRLYGGGEAQDLSHRILQAGYQLEYAPDAVVVHYHRQSVPALLRSAYRRGARSTLRRVLWDQQAVPTRGRVRAETRTFIAALGGFRRLRSRSAEIRANPGMQPGDAPWFALLEWASQALWSAGKLRMMARIAAGRETLDGREVRTAGERRNPLIWRGRDGEGRH